MKFKLIGYFPAFPAFFHQANLPAVDHRPVRVRVKNTVTPLWAHFGGHNDLRTK